MRLLGVELRTLTLAFREPIGTSAGTHRIRPAIVLRVVTDAGEGWGEGAAMAAGTAVDPPLDQVWRELVEVTLPRLAVATSARGGVLPEASRITALLAGSPEARSAAAVLEMAVLDIELRQAGGSLVDRLFTLNGSAGPVPRSVEAGAMVGIPADRRLGTLLGAVGRLAAEGFRRVRVKIEPGWDLEPLTALRTAHPDLALQADANGAYRLDATGAADARRLAELDPLGLACIEQPLPPADLPSHALLGARLATPICLDESLSTTRRVQDALRYGACAVACLKPSRLGGVFATQVAQAACATAGVPAFVGGFFECGLGRTVNASLAALPGFSLPGDLSAPGSYLVEDPFDYPAPLDGRVALHRGPGVAPPPDPDRLERWSEPGRTLWVPYKGPG